MRFFFDVDERSGLDEIGLGFFGSEGFQSVKTQRGEVIQTAFLNFELKVLYVQRARERVLDQFVGITLEFPPVLQLQVNADLRVQISVALDSGHQDQRCILNERRPEMLRLLSGKFERYQHALELPISKKTVTRNLKHRGFGPWC